MRWISFIQSDALTRSLFHVFPTSKGGFSAQPVVCSITLFGDRAEPQVVGIEGVQLNQPDGMRLDELFPRLKEGGNSLSGLIVDLEPPTSRTDVSRSSCSIELVSRQGSVLFPMLAEQSIQDLPAQLAIVQDGLTETSLILVNAGEYPTEVRLEYDKLTSDMTSPHSHVISISPLAVQEFPLSNLTGLEWSRSQQLLGEMGIVPVTLHQTANPLQRVFLVYRSVPHKSIVSVVSL